MSAGAGSVIAVLALVSQRLTELASRLRANPLVRSVSYAINPRRYADADRVECFVEVELSSGNGVGFWLEFRYEGGSWVIESSIRHNTATGEDELLGLATRYAVDDEEFVAELDGASSALVAAANEVDLSRL